MSHDGEHYRLRKLLEALAAARGLKFIPCPATADDMGFGPEDGILDYGRGDRDCPICDGAAEIVVTRDGYDACPEDVGSAVDIKGRRCCSKCRQPIDPRDAL